MTNLARTTRRDRILEAAEREFAAHGFAGARMERIAALAEVNKQLLFHYFGSKAELHDAAIVAALRRAEVRASPAGQPGERLRQLIGQLQQVTAGSPALLTILANLRLTRSITGSAAREVDAWLARATDCARQILDDGQRSGHFRDDLDSAPIAELVVSTSLGTIAPAPRAESDTSPTGERIRDTLVRMVMDYCAWR